MPPIAAGGAAPSGGCPRGPDGSPPWATSPPSIGLPNTAGYALTLGRSCRQLEALPAVFRIEQRGERLAPFGDFTARIRDAQDRAVHGGLLGPRPVELDFDVDLAFQRSLDGCPGDGRLERAIVEHKRQPIVRRAKLPEDGHRVR